MARPYSSVTDLETFVAEIDTNGFMSQVTGCGARDFVRRLQVAGPGVVVRLASWHPLCPCGEPLAMLEDACPACCRARQQQAIGAQRRTAA